MNNVRRLVVYSIGLALVCSSLVWAQDGPPTPGSEHEELGFFVGQWISKGAVNENPVVPAGEFTGKEDCDWFDGKFAVVCKTEGEGPMGSMTGIAIHSYSPIAGAYTYYSIESNGMAMTTIPKGTRDGKTWTYDDDSEMGKSRFTIVQTSDTSYTFKWELESEDGQWMTVMEGKSVKS